MDDEYKVGITAIISFALVIISLISWGITNTVQGNAEQTKRLEQCVKAGGDWDFSDKNATKYVCTNGSDDK